jgi:hypothetical protein
MNDARSSEADPWKPSPARDVQPSSGNHRIDIAFVRYGHGGTNYRVIFRGETLIENTREPIFNACRALVAKGLKGRLEMWAGEPYPRMIVRDIERGANSMIVEGAKTAPRIVEWNPHPRASNDDDVH